jgi:hypothetical protein
MPTTEKKPEIKQPAEEAKDFLYKTYYSGINSTAVAEYVEIKQKFASETTPQKLLDKIHYLTGVLAAGIGDEKNVDRYIPFQLLVIKQMEANIPEQEKQLNIRGEIEILADAEANQAREKFRLFQKKWIRTGIITEDLVRQVNIHQINLRRLISFRTRLALGPEPPPDFFEHARTD